jgi:hypothetical protein
MKRSISFIDWTDTEKLPHNLALAVIGMLCSDAGKCKSPGEIAEIQREPQPLGAGFTPKNLDLNFRCSLRSVQGDHGASLSDQDSQPPLECSV